MTASPQPARRLRWWFAFATAAIVLCTVMVAVVVIAASNARNSTEVADATVRRMGGRTADLMVSHLDDAIESAAALDILLTPEQLAARSDDLDRLLAVQVVSVPQISGAFVGFPDGAFRFVSRSDDGEITLRRIDTLPVRTATDAPVAGDLTVGTPVTVDTEYDPRARPWYERALESDDSAWTDPYVFFSSQQPGVTLSQTIVDDRGQLLGVIGIDVRLDELTEFLDNLPTSGEAEAFITAGYSIVAAPTGYELLRQDDDGSLELGTLDQLGIDEDEFRLLALGQSPISTDDGGRLHQIELIAEDAPRWAVLVRTERPELSASVDRLARLSIAIILLTGLLLLLAVPIVTRSLRKAIDDLDRRASVDTLTDVLNRGAALDAASRALELSAKTGHEFTVAVMDLDDFKRINDEHGHPIGDEALSELGEVLIESVRERDIVGRIGGDEFMVGFRHVDRDHVEGVLTRIQQRLAERPEPGERRPAPSLTIGVSQRAGRQIDIKGLIAEADDALIAAKQSNKGTVAWADVAVDAVDAVDAAGPTGSTGLLGG